MRCRFALLAVLLSACESGGGGESCAVGSPGCPCYQGILCDNGVECVSGFCAGGGDDGQGFEPDYGTWFEIVEPADLNTCPDFVVSDGYTDSFTMADAVGFEWILGDGADPVVFPCVLDGMEFSCEYIYEGEWNDNGDAQIQTWTTQGEFTATDYLIGEEIWELDCEGPGCADLAESFEVPQWPCTLRSHMTAEIL